MSEGVSCILAFESILQSFAHPHLKQDKWRSSRHFPGEIIPQSNKSLSARKCFLITRQFFPLLSFI